MMADQVNPNKSCPLCVAQFVNTDEFEAHKSSAQHRINYIKYFLDKNKSEFISNKHGVNVSCLENTDCIPELKIASSPNTTKEIYFCIENTGETVIFAQCEFIHKMSCRSSLTDKYEVSQGNKSVRLLKGENEKYFVKLELHPMFVGIYTAPLVFHFKQEDGPPFYIVRYISLHCEDSMTLSLQVTEPFDRSYMTNIVPPAKTIYSGVSKKKSQQFHNYPNSLQNIKIDSTVTKAIEEIQLHFRKLGDSLSQKGSFAKELMILLRAGLNKKVYTVLFQILLNFEKIQMDYDIRKYDMKNVTMKLSSQSNELELYVPGLSENRPSILKYDKLYVRITAEKHLKDDEYEGVINSTNDCKVLLGFNEKLMSKYFNGMLFDVRFTYSTLPIKSAHRALYSINNAELSNILFSDWSTAASCPPLFSITDKLTFYNRDIHENPEQAVAIKHIIAGSSLPAPYLVHGPPGTGKTVTIVEAIKQICRLFSKPPRKAYILVCTPSNSAADIVVERLLEHLPPRYLLRYYGASRAYKLVSAKIRNAKCTNYDAAYDEFSSLTVKEITTYQVVISTLVNCTRLVSMGVPKGHFTHIFIDEAGHSIEPESLIPISGLLKSRIPKKDGFGGQVVLSGDPLQLGPVIRCKVAEKFGLGLSLLERLMSSCDIYKRVDGRYNPRVLTRLIRNYRSHPTIIKLPSELFYDNELQVFANQLDRESLCQWQGLPNPGFPVLFHGVLGKDMQEAKSPSYFNVQEISIVVDYVSRLLNERKVNIQPNQIAVLSPYRQQVKKIRLELLKKRFDAVLVGSVDELQGQERRIIIISTVRSNPDLMAYDQQYRLGFVKNPKRFNVALTRAKSLLIIVGNPKLLSLDRYWNTLLMFCWKSGSYVGVFYDPPEEEMEDLCQRLGKLGLLPKKDEEIKISHKAQQEDPQWRSDI